MKICVGLLIVAITGGISGCGKTKAEEVKATQSKMDMNIFYKIQGKTIY
jgi:hypothetical protein